MYFSDGVLDTKLESSASKYDKQPLRFPNVITAIHFQSKTFLLLNMLHINARHDTTTNLHKNVLK